MLAAPEVVRRLGGRATYAEVMRHASRASLRRSVEEGALRRVRRGVYATPELPSGRVVAAATGGVLSHTSAARALGLEVSGGDGAVHVTVPRGGRVTPVDRVVVHWKPLPDDEVVGHLTHPLRTVLDCAAGLPFPEALAVADSALRQGWVSPERLLAAAERRRGPGRARCLAVARHADPRPHNGFESVLRGHLIEGGVGDLAAQHAVPLPAFTAHVDLADVARRIAVEADSYTYHASRTAFTDDCERYDELGVSGWLVLRFTWEEVTFRTEWVVDTVRRARASRRRRPA